MRNMEGTSGAQWYRGEERKHTHDLRSCRENSVLRDSLLAPECERNIQKRWILVISLMKDFRDWGEVADGDKIRSIWNLMG